MNLVLFNKVLFPYYHITLFPLRDIRLYLMQFSMYSSCLRANSEDKIVEDNLLIQDSI